MVEASTFAPCGDLTPIEGVSIAEGAIVSCKEEGSASLNTKRLRLKIKEK